VEAVQRQGQLLPAFVDDALERRDPVFFIDDAVEYRKTQGERPLAEINLRRLAAAALA